MPLNKICRKWKWPVLSIFLLLGLGHLYYNFTGDFRVSYLMERSPFPLEVAIPTPSQKEIQTLERILDQNFYYLAHGNQTFVFLSEDGKHVLKLFKKDYLTRTWLTRVLPPIPPFRKFFLHRGERKEYRKRTLLRGYSIAYAYDRGNTGLLYFLLNQEEKWDRLVTLNDKFGIQRRIVLGDYVFAVQEKATTTRQELSQLLSKGDVEAAKQRIHQLFELYFSEYRKGILDRDYNIIDNTGFVGNRAIRQDVGKIRLEPSIQNPKTMKRNWQRVTKKRLLPWIKKYYPQYYSKIEKEVGKLYS